MFNQKYGNVSRQGCDGLQQLFTLASWYTGNRLVEQQDARLAGQRNGNLQQAALAIRQHMGGLVHDFRQMELLQQRFAARNNFCVTAQCFPPGRAQAVLLRHGQCQRLQRGQRVKQLVDLESTHHAALDAPVGCQVGDVFAQQCDAAFGRLQHAGEQVDQRRFASTIGADQRMACAFFKVQRDVVGGRDTAKTHDQAFG